MCGEMGWSGSTLVRKSLHPAAKASCLSLCRLLAVRATMITGLLNKTVLGRLSSPSGSSLFSVSGALLDALLLNTPMLFSLSSLLISFVASRPLMMGNWMSINTK